MANGNGIRVDSPDTRKLVAMELVQKASQSTLRDLTTMGVTPELVDRLAKVPADALPQLARTLDIRVTINAKALEMMIVTTDTEREQRIQLDYFIQHGATNAMLTRLFPNFSQDLIRGVRDAVRERNGLQRNGRVKTEVPLALSRRIYEAWEKQPQEMPVQKRLIALHEQFKEMSMATLFALVMEAA
jgi:hypothetical protein